MKTSIVLIVFNSIIATQYGLVTNDAYSTSQTKEVISKLYGKHNATSENQSIPNLQYNQYDYVKDDISRPNQRRNHVNDHNLNPSHYLNDDSNHSYQNQHQNQYLDRNLKETFDGDTRIPFWNIAHMINSKDQIEPMIG